MRYIEQYVYKVRWIKKIPSVGIQRLITCFYLEWVQNWIYKKVENSYFGISAIIISEEVSDLTRSNTILSIATTKDELYLIADSILWKTWDEMIRKVEYKVMSRFVFKLELKYSFVHAARDLLNNEVELAVVCRRYKN